ncbi:MAG: Ig-like domain-containing protein [Clostridiales bacterium]|nr:Ig-like domain-containing protein [Clostridiales bacterium]
MNKLKTIVAVICAVTLLATGTLAYKQLIEVRNEFMGQKDGVTVHDDFDPGTGKKDVYIENQNDTTLYVRVKLDETLNLTRYTWRPSSASDWVTHKYAATAENCGHSNTAGDLYHDYFIWNMGGSKWYMPTDGSQPLSQDTTNYEGVPGAKQTPNAAIVNSAAFLAMSSAEQDTFIGWIFASDGYAYWSQPLRSGEVTGLLLHGVTRQASLQGKSYYYAINVLAYAADITDIPDWKEGNSPDGNEVIDIIVKPEIDPPGEVSVRIAENNQTIGIGETVLLHHQITPPDYALNKEISWSSNNPAAATVVADAQGNATVSGVAEGIATITLSVGDYSDSITVTVGNTTPPIIPPPTSVSIDGGGSKTIKVGETYSPTYTVSPPEYAIGKTPGWISADPAIASVDGTGTISGVAEGSVVVTLTVGDVSTTITIIVEAAGGTNGGLEVKPPTNPDKGYTSHLDPDETGAFSSSDKMVNVIFDGKGAFRLEDILVSTDYSGLSVEPLDSKYAGKFEIGTISGKPAILYSALPDREEAYAQWLANNNTIYPTTTMLRLTQNGKSVEIKVTMEYQGTLLIWE